MANLIADFNIWSLPSRNMKVDYETQNRTISSVQVRFTFTYTKNYSSGHSGFSQYATPTINGEAQSRITLKGNSPTDWYDTPIVVTTEWYTVSQSWDKTSFSVSMQFTSADGDDSTVTKTGTVSFSSFAAKSTLSVSNGTMDVAQTLKISRQGSSLTDTITYSCGSASGTIVTKTSSTSVSWTPPLSLAKQTPNSKTVSCRVTCTTYNGNTSIGSSYVDIVLTVPENSGTKPTTAITATLVDGFNGKYLRNISKVRVTQAGVAKYGASISAYAFTVDGKTYTGNGATSNKIRTSGVTTITAQVTDTRGFRGTATAKITISAYAFPAVIPATGHTEVICERCDAQGNPSNTGAYLHLLAGGRYSSVGGKNSITMAYSYRSMTGTFSTPVSYTPNTDLILNLSLKASKAYEVKVDISDAVGESSSALYSIPAEVIPLHLGAGGLNVAIGGYCDYTKTDEFLCHWDANFKQGIKLNDENVADFIVEQGTSGFWNYEKWHSGKAVCYGKTEITDAITTSVGSGYISSNHRWDYPHNLFVSEPEYFDAYVMNGTNPYYLWCVTGRLGSATIHPTTYIASFAARSSATVTLALRAKGRWK